MLKKLYSKRFMTNVLCWKTGSTTYGFKVSTYKSIFLFILLRTFAPTHCKKEHLQFNSEY